MIPLEWRAHRIFLDAYLLDSMLSSRALPCFALACLLALTGSIATAQTTPVASADPGDWSIAVGPYICEAPKKP
ncbi:MAG: hypothetical protein ACRYGN_12435, partial [Janthinobacterium lividum]